MKEDVKNILARLSGKKSLVLVVSFMLIMYIVGEYEKTGVKEGLATVYVFAMLSIAILGLGFFVGQGIADCRLVRNEGWITGNNLIEKKEKEG